MLFLYLFLLRKFTASSTPTESQTTLCTPHKSTLDNTLDEGIMNKSDVRSTNKYTSSPSFSEPMPTILLCSFSLFLTFDLSPFFFKYIFFIILLLLFTTACKQNNCNRMRKEHRKSLKRKHGEGKSLSTMAIQVRSDFFSKQFFLFKIHFSLLSQTVHHTSFPIYDQPMIQNIKFEISMCLS